MAKFVVAFRDRDTAEKIACLLKENGYEVLRVCTAGDEVKRTFKMIQDGILISGYRLKDRPIDQVAEDLSERVEVLCISNARNIENLDSRRIFKVAGPVSRPMLTAWADMMTQLHYRNLPRKNESDKSLIDKAKLLIMEEFGFSEAQAHRHLQKLSMKLGIPITKAAEQILRHESR